MIYLLLMGLLGNAAWQTSYDVYIQGKAPKELTDAPASVMGKFCPRWGELGPMGRQRFYSDLFYAMAAYESAWNPLSMYWEKSQGLDKVTNKIAISEGLMQLSYQDSPWAQCGFDYSKNKKFHLDDLSKRAGHVSWLSVHAETDILNPYKNLQCALNIMKYKRNRWPAREFQEMMGKYWSVMADKVPQIKNLMLSRQSTCWK